MELNPKPDVVVIGELNVDIILNTIEGFPEMGKEKIARKMDLTLGSSSAIFASNLSTLGTKVAFIGKTGTDAFASLVVKSLEAKGVDTSNIIQSADSNTGATIVLNYGQDRAMVTYPGAMENLKIEDINFDFLLSARHLHFSSIFLQPGIKKSLPDLFKKAKAIGLTISVDPQGDPAEKWDADLSDILPVIDIFMPNKTELLLLTHSDTLNEAINKIKVMSPDLILVVKDSDNGAYCWNSDKLIHQPAFLNTDIIDCIGAGDSFNAGFIHEYIKGNSLEQCLRAGALTGAVSTTKPGGTGAFDNLTAFREIALSKFKMSL